MIFKMSRPKCRIEQVVDSDTAVVNVNWFEAYGGGEVKLRTTEVLLRRHPTKGMTDGEVVALAQPLYVACHLIWNCCIRMDPVQINEDRLSLTRIQDECHNTCSCLLRQIWPLVQYSNEIWVLPQKFCIHFRIHRFRIAWISRVFQCMFDSNREHLTLVATSLAICCARISGLTHLIVVGGMYLVPIAYGDCTAIRYDC
jgi:hypothetical protein